MVSFTKYEEARIIGARALQISMGAPILTSFLKKELVAVAFSPIEIAKKEFRDKALPLTIKRPLPSKL
jgi:DNA-directed RNA polymerase subunit K